MSDSWQPLDCSTPGLPVHHQLPELVQTHVHWVGDAIQSFHPLSSPSPSAPNFSQHQSLFQWVSSSHQVAKVLEFQLQHQSFQWIFMTDVSLTFSVSFKHIAKWFSYIYIYMEKEMATHSSVLAWRIPGMGEPGGLSSMGSHRVGHDWSDLAAYI